MKNILLVQKEEVIRDGFVGYLKAGLGGEEVDIITVEKAQYINWQEASNYFDVVLLGVEKGKPGVAVQYGREVINSTTAPTVVLIAEAPLLVHNLLRPQEDIQVIEPEDLALLGFYLERLLREDSSSPIPIKYYTWLREEGLDSLYFGPYTSEQKRELNESLLRLFRGMDESGFLSQQPRDYMLKHRVHLGEGLSYGCREMLRQILGSGCHKER